MKHLLEFVALCAAICLCVCYDDSHESSESTEDLFVPPNQANAFINPQRGSSPTKGNRLRHYNFMRKVKSPAETQAETCEDHFPCRFYAYHHGFQKAYQRYFNTVNQPQRADGIRQY